MYLVHGDGVHDDICKPTKRIKTYIEGFDEYIDGGIPQGYVVLVAGTSGTMKSSITYNILYNNALDKGLKGVYVSLEQNIASLLDHMHGLGMNSELVKGKVEIWDLGSIRTDQFVGELWLNVFKRDVMAYKEKHGLDMLVLDSLPALELVAGFKNPRIDYFYFFEWLRELDITCFLIAEMSNDPLSAYGKHDEDFLSDGIIHVKMEKIGDVNIQRRIRCVKMRATNHSPNYYTLLFSDSKFQVTKVISDTIDF